MCSIVGSFDVNKIISLCELNQYRGAHSHSIAEYRDGDITLHNRDLGPLSYDELPMFSRPGSYYIVHQQAPTTLSRDETSIHPARIQDHFLWHNGILKPSTIKKLQEEFKDASEWDTHLLLRHLMKHKTPDNIDGSFACVYFDSRTLYFFRNEIAPLFIDDNFNLSSTKFEGSRPLVSNVMMRFDGTNIHYEDNSKFKTVNNPYYFEEDE